MSILDIECACGSYNLTIDFTKEEGMKHIFCRECGLSWTDPDDWDPKNIKKPTITEPDSSNYSHTAIVEE